MATSAWRSRRRKKTIPMKVISRLRKFHLKAVMLLKELGFIIIDEKDISSRPYDMVARKNGQTYYIDVKAPLNACQISVNELEGMSKLSRRGIPLYLFMLPKGGYMIFKLDKVSANDL